MILDQIVRFPPVRKLNTAVYVYRRNAWRWSPAFRAGPEVPIDRPVYLLGTQNGGLTLLSRILHRHAHAVSASGDHRHWAGEDELQDGLKDILPEEFGWRRADLPGLTATGHSWLYATDAYLAHYRRRARDLDPAVAARYRRILQGVLRMHGLHGSARFIDKSQSLTPRVGMVHAALADCDSRFVLVSRNPYAVVWSQANRNGDVTQLGLSIEDRVALCCQHWKNSFQAALEDAADPAIKLRHWRFEDILSEPGDTVRQICDFVELPWDPGILPGPRDRIPFGSMYDAWNRRKWYPLRTDVNDRALGSLPGWARDRIEAVCGDLASRLGYAAPESRK